MIILNSLAHMYITSDEDLTFLTCVLDTFSWYMYIEKQEAHRSLRKKLCCSHILWPIWKIPTDLSLAQLVLSAPWMKLYNSTMVINGLNTTTYKSCLILAGWCSGSPVVFPLTLKTLAVIPTKEGILSQSANSSLIPMNLDWDVIWVQVLLESV